MICETLTKEKKMEISQELEELKSKMDQFEADLEEYKNAIKELKIVSAQMKCFKCEHLRDNVCTNTEEIKNTFCKITDIESCNRW